MRLSIKRIFWGVSCLFLLCGSVAAETKYVREIIYVTLREARGIEKKVIAKLPSGQKLEIVKADNEWTQVRLADGTTGWILSRYVTAKQPSSYLLRLMKAEQKASRKESSSISEENKKFTEEIQRLKEQNQVRNVELENAKKKLSQTSQSYGNLKKESAGYLQLKAKYEKTVTQLSETKKDAQKYQKALEKIEFSNDIKWFLSGAGVLVLGFLIGFSARPRRKSTLR